MKLIALIALVSTAAASEVVDTNPGSKVFTHEIDKEGAKGNEKLSYDAQHIDYDRTMKGKNEFLHQEYHEYRSDGIRPDLNNVLKKIDPKFADAIREADPKFKSLMIEDAKPTKVEEAMEDN